jgi:hypothetical protein
LPPEYHLSARAALRGVKRPRGGAGGGASLGGSTGGCGDCGGGKTGGAIL